MKTSSSSGLQKATLIWTYAQMIPMLEEYRQWFPPTDAQRELRLERKCDVEFVL